MDCDDESSGALLPRRSKGNSSRKSKVNDNNTSVTHASLQQVEVDGNGAANERCSQRMSSKFTAEQSHSRDFDVPVNVVDNAKEKCSGGKFMADLTEVTDHSQGTRVVTSDEDSFACSILLFEQGSTVPSVKSEPVDILEPGSTTLEAKAEPSVYFVAEQGVWKCRHCSWVYPAIKPRVELIQTHKEHNHVMNNVQALFGKGFPVKHETEEGSEGNAFFDKGNGAVEHESENTKLSTDEMVLEPMIEKTIAKLKENERQPSVGGHWHIDHMDLEPTMEVYKSESSLTGEVNHMVKTEIGISALQDLVSSTSSQTGTIVTTGNGGMTTAIEVQETSENTAGQQHQYGNSVFESVMQNPQLGFLRGQEETQLKEHWSEGLQRSTSTVKVEEEIARVLKEQKSYDLLCPVCGSCITKRVILRKRKRTSPVSVDRWYQEPKDEAKEAVSEGYTGEIMEDQNDRPEIPNEDSEETEAYGCLECLSLFFRKVTGVQYSSTNPGTRKVGLAVEGSSRILPDPRKATDKERQSFHCLPFLYPWRQSIKKESEPSSRADLVVSIPQAESAQEAKHSLSNVEKGDDLVLIVPPTEDVSKKEGSASNLGVSGTNQQNKGISKALTTSTVNESFLENKEKKSISVGNIEHIHGDGKDSIAAGSNLDTQLKDGLGFINKGIRADLETKFAQDAEVLATVVGKGGYPGVSVPLTESVSEDKFSASSSGDSDTIQHNKVVSEASTKKTVTDSLFENERDKATSGNKTDVIQKDGRDTATENDNLDTRLNLGLGSTKVSDELLSTLPYQAEGSHMIPNNKVSYETSITETTSLTVISSLEYNGGTETKGTATEAIKTAQSFQVKKQNLHHQHMERTEDQLTKLPFNGIGIIDTQQKTDVVNIQHKEPDKLQTGTPSGWASLKALDVLPREGETRTQDEGIHDELLRHGKGSNIPREDTAAQWDKDLPRNVQGSNGLRQGTEAQQNKSESYKKDYLCSCIPVTIQTVWSIWPSKGTIADEQLNEPLLIRIEDKENVHQKASTVQNESSAHGMLESNQHLTNLQSPDAHDTETISEVQSAPIESRSALAKNNPVLLLQKGDALLPQSPPISPHDKTISTDVTISHIATVIEVESNDPQPSDAVNVTSELMSVASAQLQAPTFITEWDILKSIVYGGLTVSLTSLGVVSSAAGGEAKTLTVIAVGLANLVAGLFAIFSNILDLGRYHQDQFIDTVGHRFWFNGSVAILSYLIVGSLAPITYGFSFEKSDNRNYKFLAASAVSLVSIILLALGKARVTKRSYIRTVIMFIVTGLWASIAGYFAGEYIKKLLEKWGLITDSENRQLTQKLFYD